MKMTATEALLAMYQGEKVTHRFFTDEEYIYMKGHDIYTEEGYNMGTVYDDFWQKRGGPMSENDGWAKDWSIYEE
jgi:hypothetical protein